jgi:hypothetical protein
MNTIKKAIIAGAIFTGAVSSVQANPIAEGCRQYEGLARSIMQHRQEETSMSRLFGMIDTGDAKVDNVVKLILLDAYEQTGWASEDRQGKAVREFGNKWWKECVKNPDMFFDLD